MQDTAPYPPVPPRQPSVTHGHGDRTLAAAVLIALGGAFLLANVLPGGMSAGLVLLAFGAAFAVARFVADRPEYAVPAGILLGVGVFAASQGGDLLGTGGLLSGQAAGGWRLTCLGAGFLAAAIIGWRTQTAWTLAPGLILVPLGIAVSDGFSGGSLGQLVWLRQLWPVALIALGGWALLRGSLPEPRRTLIGVVGGALIAAYAVLALAATVASSPAPFSLHPGFGRGYRAFPGPNAPFSQSQPMSSSISHPFVHVARP